MRDGWSDPDNDWHTTHQNRSKNDDNNDASEKPEQFDALLTNNDKNSDNVTRNFLGTNHSSNCTVQYDFKCEKAQKKNNDRFGRLWDSFKKIANQN